MEELVNNTNSNNNPEFHYFIASLRKTDQGSNLCSEALSQVLPEPHLLKNAPKALTTKLKNKNATITEVPEEEIQGNPIGMLQELCMMRRWMPPEYSTEQEEGLPHERLFTILCTVGSFKEYGVGRSKKLAKRQSAHKMVQKILTIPAEDENSYKNLEDEDEVVERYNNQKMGRGLSAHSGASRKISLFHKNLKNFSGNKIEKLKTLNPEEVSNVDAIKWLKEIAIDNKLDVTFVNIEEKSKSGKYQCLVQLSTLPVAVCHGTADSIGEAQQEASIKALKYLRLLCEDSSLTQYSMELEKTVQCSNNACELY